MIYDNIDRGVYDLSNDRSGIRVGNEALSTGKSETKDKDGTTAGAGSVKIGDRKTGGGGGGCCS